LANGLWTSSPVGFSDIHIYSTPNPTASIAYDLDLRGNGRIVRYERAGDQNPKWTVRGRPKKRAALFRALPQSLPGLVQAARADQLARNGKCLNENRNGKKSAHVSLDDRVAFSRVV
jgi:hypothetical protein